MMFESLILGFVVFLDPVVNYDGYGPPYDTVLMVKTLFTVLADVGLDGFVILLVFKLEVDVMKFTCPAWTRPPLLFMRVFVV